VLIQKFIPLKPADLERWQEDPEEFLIGEDKDNELWEYELRVSFESRIVSY
jgi:hypothetical protein